MYRLLVADDERVERIALRKMINSSFPDLIVLEDAVNGYDFLEKVEDFKPDISIVDINMPGIDGLQAVQELKKRNLETKVIIHTAYSSFHYAQKAVSLGAKDYLLKPAKKKKIIELINNCINNIEKENERLNKDLNYRRIIKEVSKAIEVDFLSSEGTKNKVNLLNYLDILGIKYMNIVLPSKYKDGNQKYAILNDTLNLIENHLNSYCSCFSSTVHNNIVTLFLYAEESSSSNIQTWSEEYKDIIIRNISENIDIPVKIEIDDVNEENMNLLLFNTREDNGEIDDNSGKKDYGNRFVFYKKKIIKYINARDYDGIVKIILLYLSEIHSSNLELLRDRTKLFIYQIQHYLMDKYLILDYDMVSSNKEIASINSISEAEEYLKNFMTGVFNKIDFYSDYNMNTYVKESLEYINEHYKEDISLAGIAEKVCVSPYYLSRLFKQELNVNFTNYITEVRIHHAIDQLIQERDQSIMELSKNSGYNNYTYFCKVFKKKTGRTINSFKENCIY